MTKDVSVLATELKKCGEVLVSIAEALSAPADEAAHETQSDKPSKQYSLEDVRAVLAQKATAGFKAEVKALLGKFNAEKLSDIRPEDYEELMKEAEGIGNA